MKLAPRYNTLSNRIDAKGESRREQARDGLSIFIVEGREASLESVAVYRRHGFTLIELLVVIAVIALLMGILVPTLSRARRHAAGSACMANIRSISTGWVMYAFDNDDYLVPSQVVSGQQTSWVQVPQDEAGNPVAAQTVTCTLAQVTQL